MATRYVWGKRNLTLQENGTLASDSSTGNYPTLAHAFHTGRHPAIPILKSSAIQPGTSDQNGAKIELVSPTAVDLSPYDSQRISAGEYFCFGNLTEGEYSTSDTTFDVMYATINCDLRGLGQENSTFNIYRTFAELTGAVTRYSQYIAGSVIGTVSNSSSSAYPQNGASGSSWYTYQGSDSITASSLSYSTTAPKGGQPITITVAPANPTYGGNIRYNYQVQLDNGSWTTISSNNTVTTYNYTIPFGTNTFRARVQASDSWGFTDTDYTTGSILTVNNNEPPSVPASITVPQTILTGTTVTISWAASTDTVGAALEGYILERSTNGGAQWSQIYQGSATSTTNSVLLGTTSVMYRVKAYDAEGAESGYRTSSQVTVTQNTAPTTPSSISVPESIVDGTPYNVTWASTTDAQGNFGGYSLERQVNSGSWSVVYTGDQTTYQDTAQSSWDTVTYRIRAYDTQNFYSDYTTSPTRTVTHNVAPNPPASITLTNIVVGQQATISWGAATDSDGTIVSYTCQRSIDQNGYTTIYTGEALTCTDTIGEEWAVVSYRVFATDDDGANSTYTVSDVTDVNDGFLYITTGEETDLGTKNTPWNFVFNISATGSTQPTTVDITLELDGHVIYTNAGNAPQPSYTVPIDTRAFSSGEHTLVVAATSENFASATATFTFNVTNMNFPDAGVAIQFEDNEANPLFNFTLASMVLMPNGEMLSDVIPNFGNVARIQNLTYIGNGASGSGSPNRLHFQFKPLLVFIRQNGSMQYEAILINGNTVANSDRSTVTNGVTVTWGDQDVTWYSATSANVQLNAALAVYDVVAIG